MTDPKLKLVLTDILLLNASDQARIYYENDILRNTINGVWTRTDSRYEFPKDGGITLIMTGFDLWNAFYLNGNLTNSEDENGACTPKNLALCEDDGLTFSGVGSAAQAIAVLLGAKFEYIKEEGECSRDEGYLLSSNRTGLSVRYNLSPCGKTQIKEAIKQSDGKRKACLLNEPPIQSSVKEVDKSLELPIDFFSNTNPCNLIFGSRSCENRWKQVPSCKLECCIKQGRNETVNKHDGTSCEADGICSNGECIPRPPKYQKFVSKV
uniref:Putative metalloprotease n=1 Tax=Ixodes ricinus TaxID=34613 RepID=A0A0K8RH19_IXORI